MHIHYSITIKMTALLTGIIGISMLLPLMCALYYDESECATAFGTCAMIFGTVGMLVYKLVKVDKIRLNIRDGYLIVALCWFLVSLLGAVPFTLSGGVSDYASAFFESAAGFTTTGATTIDIDEASKSMILWKSVTHWLGGMGILVFTISILPRMGVNSFNLAKAETPGPKLEKLSNRISDTARILYFMYFLLSFVEFLLLLISGMGLFDATVNTMGCISTSSIMAHSSGVMYYDSFYVEFIVSLFSILSTINYTLYYHIAAGRLKDFISNIELRVYLCIIMGSTLLITLSLWLSKSYDSIWQSARFGFSQVVSFISTSGYCAANFTDWPQFCQMILFTLLFIGGCGASTAGSIKVVRILVLFKLVLRGFTRRLHPNSVSAVKVGGEAVSAPMVSAITTFTLLYVLILMISTLVLSTQGLDIETTLSTAVSCLSNAGIGLGEIGISGDYEIFSDSLQVFMGVLMIVGRLELFTILFLFIPRFWKSGK